MYQILQYILTIIFYSTIYSIIEEIYRYIIDRTHTTLYMWIVNSIFVCPFLLCLELLLLNYLNTNNCTFYFVALIFPLIIWTIEIIIDFISKYIFKKNVMWSYDGITTARFNGAIRLDYYPIWILLFLVSYYIIIPLKIFFLT